jgi:hypothetical protein
LFEAEYERMYSRTIPHGKLEVLTWEITVTANSTQPNEKQGVGGSGEAMQGGGRQDAVVKSVGGGGAVGQAVVAPERMTAMIDIHNGSRLQVLVLLLHRLLTTY